MSSHSNQNVDIHDEVNYDPTVWVPKAESHGTKDIWAKFWILMGLTGIDVILYFLIPTEYVLGRAFIFILLGIVKAWFIVGAFMHMKHEKKGFIYMIILPMILIIFFLCWMMFEGNFWGSFR
jgi:cytochrome c oxidase subunit IV